MGKTTIPALCRNCGDTQIALCKQPKANGGYHLYAVCLSCWQNANGGGQWISQVGIDMDKIPTREELMGV
jgi:ABC-type Fe2+-enterobactin transport system substrate-binding protein